MICVSAASYHTDRGATLNRALHYVWDRLALPLKSSVKHIYVLVFLEEQVSTSPTKIPSAHLILVSSPRPAYRPALRRQAVPLFHCSRVRCPAANFCAETCAERRGDQGENHADRPPWRKGCVLLSGRWRGNVEVKGSLKRFLKGLFPKN